MRSCSAVMSATSASRCSAGRSGLRASVSRFARIEVSGVRSSWPASAAKRRVASSARSVASVDAPRRASIALSAPASWWTSSGPSSGSGVERSCAPVTRAAPARRRASGRSATVVKPQAASAVSASAEKPSSSTSRRIELTRSSTGASELSTWSRGRPPSGSVTESDRHGVPAMSTVSKPSRSGAPTRRVGHVARLLGHRLP